MAPGDLEVADACSEVVLFTIDNDALNRVAKADEDKGEWF